MKLIYNSCLEKKRKKNKNLSYLNKFLIIVSDGSDACSSRKDFQL